MQKVLFILLITSSSVLLPIHILDSYEERVRTVGRNKSFDIIPATQQEADYIDDQLGEYNNQHVPFTQTPNPILKNYIIKDKGKIIAGIKADIYHWKILYVQAFWVDEHYRGKNLGTMLLNKVESEAKEIGATLVHLDTFDFQAKDFYLKHGYEVFGVLDDCPQGHKRYYLKKKL